MAHSKPDIVIPLHLAARYKIYYVEPYMTGEKRVVTTKTTTTVNNQQNLLKSHINNHASRRIGFTDLDVEAEPDGLDNPQKYFALDRCCN